MSPVCRGCDATLNSILIDLGRQPISNALICHKEEFAEEKTYPLVVYVCDACGLVQLNNEIDRGMHFNSNYTYFSSYSTSWLDHAKNLAEKTIKELQLTSEELVVEIASNDGYLLQYFKNAGVQVLGFEPSENVATEAISLRNIPTRVEFFGINAAVKLRQEQEAPKLVIGINVLAHVPDLCDFLGGIETLLDNESRAILEFPHLLSMLSEFQFDTIYHEHYSYLSLTALNPIVRKCGMKIVDVEKIGTHGGSLRVQLAKIASKESVSTELNRIILEELAMDPRDPIVRKEFQNNVSRIVQDLSVEVDRLNKSGKRIIGYGAAAKGNTILNLANIDAAQIEYVIDKNPFKQGKFLPGSHIPIYGTQELETRPPDAILILPWNLSSEIREQLKARNIQTPTLRAIPKLEYLE